MTTYKSLMLLRHAHSGAAKDPFGQDHERGLTRRGINACGQMARWMAGKNVLPDAVFCSTATRAQETWTRISTQLPRGEDIPVVDSRDLYLAPPNILLRHFQAVPENITSIMCVAHNPGIAELAFELAARNPTTDISQMAMNYPTAALAVFQFDGPWSDIDTAATTLKMYVVPKKLPTD